MTTLDELLVKLRASAAQSSEILRRIAEAKSLRQGDCDPPRDDLYSRPTPEQILEGQAADDLEAAARENERLKRALKRIGKIRDPAGDAGKWGFTGLATAQTIARNALSGGPQND